MRLTFGYTPCPNDAFAFHALAHGLVPAPFDVEPVLLDIEELNRRAHGAELQLTKLSFGAAAVVADEYRLLRSGAALGLQQTLLGVLAAATPPAFAALVDATSWRVAFAAALAGPLLGVLALRRVPEPGGPTRRRDARRPGTSAIPPAAR